MPESVDNDGAVRGPAPQGNSNIATFSPGKDWARRGSTTDGKGVAAASDITSNECNGVVVSLELDEKYALRAELSEVNRQLVEANASQDQYEKRLERVSGTLLIGGERIPALDQSSFSMMQEAYLNASIAAIVGAEKIIILQEYKARLEGQLQELLTGSAVLEEFELPRAA